MSDPRGTDTERRPARFLPCPVLDRRIRNPRRVSRSLEAGHPIHRFDRAGMLGPGTRGRVVEGAGRFRNHRIGTRVYGALIGTTRSSTVTV